MKVLINLFARIANRFCVAIIVDLFEQIRIINKFSMSNDNNNKYFIPNFL